MDLLNLAKEEIQKFIREHENDDLSSLILSAKEFHGIPISVLADQIKSRKKAKNKLPSWYQADGLIFPPPVSLEQASSEATGKYKQDLVKGNSLLDLTGGMGIDCSFFANVFKHVFYLERHENLVKCFQHNATVLKIKNISFVNELAEVYLNNLQEDKMDVIYLDPARRDGANNRVYALSDCEPNVVELLPELLMKSAMVLVKVSPMLDITHSLKELNHVKEVHVISVENECKELLFLIARGYKKEPKISTVNIERGKTQTFSFFYSGEQNSIVKKGEISKYLYEPNASVMKAGSFKSLCNDLNLVKLDEHTHLYSSDQIIDDFTGKIYEVISSYAPQKKVIKSRLSNYKISVKTRNYPEGVTSIRKKYGLKDGNDLYVFFCRIDGSNQVVETRKL